MQRCRPVGPVPRPPTEPVTVQHRASNTGVIMVAGQRVAPGRQFQHHTVTMHVSETTLPSSYPTARPGSSDGPPTSPCVASRDSAHGPLPPQFPSRTVKHQLGQIRQEFPASRHIRESLPCDPTILGPREQRQIRTLVVRYRRRSGQNLGGARRLKSSHSGSFIIRPAGPAHPVNAIATGCSRYPALRKVTWTSEP